MGTDVFKIIDDTPVFSGYIKSDEEIDKDTLTKIRARYSEAEEMKLHRQKLNGENLAAYEEYNSFVEACRNEGQGIKLNNKNKIDNLVEFEIKEENETKTIMINNENS